MHGRVTSICGWRWGAEASRARTIYKSNPSTTIEVAWLTVHLFTITSPVEGLHERSEAWLKARVGKRSEPLSKGLASSGEAGCQALSRGMESSAAGAETGCQGCCDMRPPSTVAYRTNLTPFVARTGRGESIPMSESSSYLTADVLRVLREANPGEPVTETRVRSAIRRGVAPTPETRSGCYFWTWSQIRRLADALDLSIPDTAPRQ